MTVDDIQLIQLPKILDFRGNLSFLQNHDHFPFEMKRVYWIYDVPGGEIRGGHAFKKQEEVIIALSGSFDVIIDDANEKRKITLNRSYFGLYVRNTLWRHMENFSTNSVALVLSNTGFDEDDYIRDYEDFKVYKNGASI